MLSPLVWSMARNRYIRLRRSRYHDIVPIAKLVTFPSARQPPWVGVWVVLFWNHDNSGSVGLQPMFLGASWPYHLLGIQWLNLESARGKLALPWLSCLSHPANSVEPECLSGMGVQVPMCGVSAQGSYLRSHVTILGKFDIIKPE